MAVNTDNFGFKKPDESDFYDVQDQNGNWDIADQELEKLNSPTFEDYTEDTSVPEAVTAIEALKSKSKIGMLLSNIKAAFKGACLIGHIVNNCVTDNPSLPLSAAQGKVLMDYYTKLYSDLPSPTGLLIQYGHESNYNPADDNFISVTFEKSYTQWVQVFCNIPATMTTGYIHITTAHSITLTGCKLKGKAIKIENLAIVLEMETPSEGIQWVAIGV